MKSQDKKFLANALAELIENKISVVLKNTKKVKYTGSKISTNGFFDSSLKEFAMGTDRSPEEWLGLFVHEYNHFKQTKENVYCDRQTCKALEELWDWLDNKIELSPAKVRRITKRVQIMEADCDRRSFNMIKNHNLSINAKVYAKRANAYAYFYTALRKTRKWYKKAPYENQKILDLMPDKLLSDYSKLPPKYLDIVVKECL